MKKFSFAKIKEKYHNLLGNKRFLKLLSVLMAIVAWFLVVTIVDTSTYATIHNVPITVDLTDTIAQSNGLSLLDTEKQYVDIRVRGKSFYIGRMTADDFTATVNLTSVTVPGTYSLDVKVEAKDPGDDFEIVNAEPQTVNLSFDRFATVTLPLEASAPNVTPAEGFIIDQYTVSPGEITISGPQATVSRITRCVVENTESQQLTGSAIIDGVLQLKDKNGADIDQTYLNFSATDLKISIPLYKETSLPLTFDYINVPAGVDVSEIGYTMEPADSIHVAIPVDALASIKAISLGEVDLRQVDIGKAISLEVPLLAGYLNLDDFSQVTVTFQSEGMASKTLACTNIVLKNVPSQYDITALSERISDIKFVGTESAIETLESSDVVATVDFSTIGAITTGQQRVEVSISVNGNMQAWAVGEKSVLVSVEAK